MILYQQFISDITIDNTVRRMTMVLCIIKPD